MGSSVGDAELHDSVRVIAAAVEFGGEFEGQGRADEALDLGGAGDGHDSGDDGDFDAGGLGALHEFPIVAVIEEELGDEEIEAGVDFAFEVVDVDGGVAAFDVFFGIGRATEAEVGTVGLADEGGQFGGVAEAAFNRGEGGLAFRRIAAQGEDVVHSGVFEPPQDSRELFAGGADAGEVSHGFEAGAVADAGDDLDGFFAGGAAGAPCDGDEIGLERAQIRDGAFELCGGFVGFRREKFEGNRRRTGSQKIPDQHLIQL